MPRVGGIEVTRAIKSDERTKRIPIVIMTSSKEEKDVADSYDLGANSYIVKPLDFESLAAVHATPLLLARDQSHACVGERPRRVASAPFSRSSSRSKSARGACAMHHRRPSSSTP